VTQLPRLRDMEKHRAVFEDEGHAGKPNLPRTFRLSGTCKSYSAGKPAARRVLYLALRAGRFRVAQVSGMKVSSNPLPAVQAFRAERKRHRNHWVDGLNAFAEWRDRLLPGGFGRLHRQVSSHSMMSHARLRGIYDAVVAVSQQGVAGAFAECGTARGGCAALMGLACRQLGQPRELWIFDTFEGLPPPSAEDPDFELARASTGTCRGEYNEVRGLLKRLGVLEGAHLVKGLFQDTVPTAEVRQIALLHLDGDWYDSTRVCLEHLYDKVSPGGIIQVDDYGHWAGARKALHEFFDLRGIRVDLNYLDYTGRQFRKPA